MHDETTTRSSGFAMSSRPPDSMDWSFPSSARDAAQVLLARQGLEARFSCTNYTPLGHLDQVNCLDFFRDDKWQYLITDSNDCTAKEYDTGTHPELASRGPTSISTDFSIYIRIAVEELDDNE
ncbi:hypothetical protein ZWY2020_022313 [Hordeum vulgare]|nr:hypothetical protein ZWY2020_022313 [Hordeum vulgare]